MATVELDVTQQSDIEKTSFSSTLKEAIESSLAATKTAENDVNRFFYTVGSYNFLLEDGLKAETLKNKKVNSVPYLPGWYKGIISIRGIIMPVLDIHEFIQTQMNKVEKRDTDRSYLLKLEHKDHPPIVFIVENLPELINIENLKKSKTTKNSPGWINNYLIQDSKKIAQINHKELLNQIIKSQ